MTRALRALMIPLLTSACAPVTMNIVRTDAPMPQYVVAERLDECVDNIKVKFFRSSVDTIRPLITTTSILSWSFTVPQGCDSEVFLVGALPSPPAKISSPGRLEVSPKSSTEYRLLVWDDERLWPTELAAKTVNVDWSDCDFFLVGQEDLRSAAEQWFVRTVPQFPGVSLESGPEVVVDPDGVHVAAALKVTDETFTCSDPVATVEADYALGVRGAFEASAKLGKWHVDNVLTSTCGAWPARWSRTITLYFGDDELRELGDAIGGEIYERLQQRPESGNYHLYSVTPVWVHSSGLEKRGAVRVRRCRSQGTGGGTGPKL